MERYVGERALSMADDAVDAALATAGDGAAFERLYQRHSPRIYGLAVRMAPSGEAEEMAQEIFVRAWQKLPSFKGEAAFGTWLYRLGINLILSQRQRSGRRREREQFDAELLERAPGKKAQLDHSMDFETALRQLPHGAKSVLLLHDVEGFKHEEIAGMLSISIGTSKSQLHRARMMMRKVLR
jgi:RNA polymerase sigma-70 factor (ECF subfamily)